MEDANHLQQEKEQANQSTLKPLFMRLQKVLLDYASKNGYTAILEAQTLPYYDPKIDVTSAISAEFDRSK